MKRRTVLKNLAAAGSLLTIPSWANCWPVTLSVARPAWLTDWQETTLADMVDTLIPATVLDGASSPGAKELNVHQFVLKMVTDCFDNAVQEAFKAGLSAVNATARQHHNRTFSACSPTERLGLLNVLKQSPDAHTREFFALIRRLTVQGYSTSEYVMTTFHRYQMAPGHYHGCVDVANRK